MIFTAKLRMMAQEGHLASTALLSGFEGLRSLNYDKPGTIYSALFDLSTGFERILKIIVILQYRLKNDLAFPTDAMLKKLGHSIEASYERCKLDGVERGVDGWPAPESHHVETLSVLTEFAKGSRYHNLNQMVDGFPNADPLVRLFELHMKIAEDSVSYRRLSAVMDDARAHCDRYGLHGWEMGPRGRYDLTVDVTYQLEVARLSTGHLVWVMLELIKPIYRVLDQLVDSVQDMELSRQVESTVPYMTEFFPFGLTTRRDALRRKQWSKLFYIAGRF